MLTGNSMLSFQGWPAGYCGGSNGDKTQSSLSSLAGEAFLVPSFATVFLDLHSLHSAPWYHEGELLEWQQQLDSSKNSDVSQSFADNGNFDVSGVARSYAGDDDGNSDWSWSNVP